MVNMYENGYWPIYAHICSQNRRPLWLCYQRVSMMVTQVRKKATTPSWRTEAYFQVLEYASGENYEVLKGTDANKCRGYCE